MPPKNARKKVKKSGNTTSGGRTNTVTCSTRKRLTRDKKPGVPKDIHKFLLSDQQKEYLGDSVTNDEPGLLILWDDDLISTALLNAASGKIENLPPEPAFLDTATSMQFKDSIHAFLRNVGGGNFGNLIAPNTCSQYDNVVLRLRDAERDPFIQALCASVGGPLAECGRVNDGRATYAVPSFRIAPPHPFVKVFA